MRTLASRPWIGYAAALCVVGLVTWLLRLIPHLAESAADFLLLLVVFLVARVWETGPGLLAAVAATVVLRSYFVSSIQAIGSGTQDIALLVFLFTALLVGRLSALSRERLRLLEAERRRIETVARLSQAFLAETSSTDFLPFAAERLRAALECDDVAVLLADGGDLRLAAGSADVVNRETADRVLSRRVGEATSLRSGARDMVLPLLVRDRAIGVLAARGAGAAFRVAEACALVLALAVEHDRSLRLAADAEAIRAREEMKSTLLAALGHDLKTPVAVARGALENWEGRAGACEESRLAGRSIATLTRVVDELLTVIRLEAGVSGPKRERASCGEIVEAAVARVGDGLGGRRLEVEPVPPDFSVNADPAQIAEALGLGLENAFAHTPEHASVRVAVEDAEGELVFAVEDDGPGIPESERRRVTEKFMRLPRSRETPGTGLGLYIAKTLSEMNDGRLEIGTARAGGTRFAIALPK
ncbi:MAG TPA: ATP-binding protein [Thermoanaerobaculia bacterium]|nr:ATP-binding protein [Thermoanaerobaculia bacterium]